MQSSPCRGSRSQSHVALVVVVRLALAALAPARSDRHQVIERSLEKPAVRDLWMAYLPRIAEEAGLGDPGAVHTQEAAFLRHACVDLAPAFPSCSDVACRCVQGRRGRTSGFDVPGRVG